MAVDKPRKGFMLSIQPQAVVKIEALEISGAKACKKQLIKIEGAHLSAAFGKFHPPQYPEVFNVAALPGLRVSKAIGLYIHRKCPFHVLAKNFVVSPIPGVYAQHLENLVDTHGGVLFHENVFLPIEENAVQESWKRGAWHSLRGGEGKKRPIFIIDSDSCHVCPVF